VLRCMQCISDLMMAIAARSSSFTCEAESYGRLLEVLLSAGTRVGLRPAGLRDDQAAGRSTAVLHRAALHAQ
jgi:hypothetical protein